MEKGGREGLPKIGRELIEIRSSPTRELLGVSRLHPIIGNRNCKMNTTAAQRVYDLETRCESGSLPVASIPGLPVDKLSRNRPAERKRFGNRITEVSRLGWFRLRGRFDSRTQRNRVSCCCGLGCFDCRAVVSLVGIFGPGLVCLLAPCATRLSSTQTSRLRRST